MALAPRHPNPEMGSSAYTPRKLEEKIRYISSMLHSPNRAPSPWSEKIMIRYVEFCEDFLRRHSECGGREKDWWVAQIRAREYILRKYGCLDSDQESELEYRTRCALAFLRESEYYARYGEYLENINYDFAGAGRVEVPHKRVEVMEKVALAEWRAMAKDVRAEARRLDKASAAPLKADIRTVAPRTHAIASVCQKMDIDFHQTMATLMFYAERLGAVTSFLDGLLAAGDPRRIARIIQTDLHDVKGVFPTNLPETEECVWAILQALRDYWFHVIEDGYYESRPIWLPKAELLEEMATRRKNPNAGKSPKLIESIVREAERLLRANEVPAPEDESPISAHGNDPRREENNITARQDSVIQSPDPGCSEAFA